MATAHTRATASESTKYGTLPVTRTNAAAAAASSLHPRPSSNTSSSSCHPLLLPLLLVLLLGSANALIYKTMFATYGESGAFFVSTGVNFLYILYGGLLLYPRMCLTDAVTPAMKALPKRRFLVMGFLDCCGTFLAAMGAVYTPGSVQTLLNQTLIPITMLVSYLCLKTRFSSIQLLGASLVLGGAAVVVLPSFFHPSPKGGGEEVSSSRWWANAIFFASNLPVACSQVYKERAFKRDKVGVLYLTQWVSIFQLFLGLLHAPLQIIPGVGSAHGVRLSSIVSSFASSWHCFWEDGEGGGRCGQHHAFLLLVGYCAVNLVFNTAGLFVSKHGSAILNVCTYALLLPITTLLFSFHPLMGAYTEPLRSTTIAGLVSVVVGFYFYQSPVLQKQKEEEEEEDLMDDLKGHEEEQEEEEEEEEEDDRLFSKVPSFQERVVAGLGPAIFQQQAHVHRKRRRGKEDGGGFGDV